MVVWHPIMGATRAKMKEKSRKGLGKVVRKSDVLACLTAFLFGYNGDKCMTRTQDRPIISK